MKPVITVRKMLGRVGYAAELHGLYVEAASKREAREAWATAAQAALVRLDRGAYIGRWRGHLYVVSPDAGGWRYWFDMFSTTDVFGTELGTREDAQDRALHHLAQCLWTPEVDDDEAFVANLPPKVQRDLIGWMSWQRRYARAKANGLNDAQAHEEACRGYVGR